MRRRLTWFYIIFYVICFSAVVYQTTLLYNPWALAAFNASLWIPQIIHTYMLRTRKGPSLQFAASLFATQCFMPLYLKIDKDNFLDQETDLLAATLLLLFMALQLFVIKRQQTHGPRWFIPKRLRMDPRAYDYDRTVASSVLARAKKVKDPTAPSSHEDDVTCVICMNYIHFAVDEHGGLIRTDQAFLDMQANNGGAEFG